uniref:Uncharacterized protein n=1 Tax=Anas platyrhynchos TaxID=8839 RepID=A0A8B9SZF4_ANAPL
FVTFGDVLGGTLGLWAGGGPNGDSLGLRLGSWLLRVLRECAYLLLCSWCIRELLD